MDDKDIKKLDADKGKKKTAQTKNYKQSAQKYSALIVIAGAFVALAAAAVWFKMDIPDELERYLIGGVILFVGTWALITMYKSMGGNK